MGLPIVRHLAIILAVASIATACTPGGPPGQGGSDTGPGTTPTRKAITISLEGEINALATELDSAGVSGLSSYLHSFLHDYGTVAGDRGEILPQLVAGLPSLDDGSWEVHDDGRMDVTWKLRQGVLWHDGTEFTSADIKFGWQVTVDDAAPLGNVPTESKAVTAIDTLDPYTVVMHWKARNRFGAQMMRSQFNILPKHLLEEDFLANKAAFGGHGYFTSTDAVIGTGPYRAAEWVRGSHLTAQAFDGYYQGRAKIDSVTFRFISDEQTTLANVLAGEIDVANRGLGWTGVQTLQQQWESTGAGKVQNQPTNWRHVLFQFRPELASPSSLLDARLRKALIHGVDRVALVDGLFPGAGAELVAHSIGYPGTPIGDAVEKSIVKYNYDPTRASQLLAEAGWQKGGDGNLVNSSTGERFQMEFNAGGGDEDDKSFALAEANYRPLGIELFYQSFGGRRQTPQESVTFTGLQKTGFPFNHPRFAGRWDSREVAGPENRYASGNRSGYANPQYDAAIDRLSQSLREADELRAWGEAWKILTEEAAVMSLFFVPQPIAVRTGVEGVFPENASGEATWRVHTWEVQ